MSEINRGLDHMANLQRGWSPGQAMLPPDPDGLNRALDRAAAEHLREVAPHLAPSAPAPPQPEPAICRHCAAGGCNPAPAFDLIAHLQRQRAFSERTFGPGARTAGVLDHIRKELLEIERDPTDLSEWIDVVLLALDGAWRHGYSPEEIASALEAKQAKNEARTWPDWRTQPMDKAIEHDRGAPAPPAEAKHHEEDCVCRECRPEMHSAQPPAEAKGEEMTAVGLRIALDAFYRQGYYAGMADMSGNREMVQEHADRAEVAVKPVLDAFAALRTRAREAEERAEKTTEHLLNSVAKAVRRGDELESERDEARQEARWLAEVFIATGHATPDIHAWLDRAKHCVGTLRESLTAANERVDALLLERDEAREQLAKAREGRA